ncbi:FAD-binding oxidoreductase [Halorientalis marina]|uniref:FAD-binding oxidoreductase n=1 Tax=Halorientalis marina TaxID=2931976 RepID=UPI001FF18D41|nr:FAD-binding oxidoreductase [Halorientalis marina]
MSDRELSFWGWGHADRFPDDEERRELKTRLEGMLGFPERPLLDPPTIDAVSIPDSRVRVPDRLSGFVSTATEDRVRHTYGKAYRDLVRGFHGDFDAAPDAVAEPADEAEIAALLDWATEERVAVVPYGGGTSVVGGVECDPDGDGSGYAGVVSLDVRALDAVLEVDPHSRSARIQAGATGPEIRDQLAEHGLQLRHYPQSYEFSTLGGWIATRAGGHFATVYTRIDDFVENVRMVTPAGTVETRRLPGSGAGPDPDKLVLGSEGAFGVITEAWMEVQPRPPYRARASVHFGDFEAAVDATREIAQARLYPANCRLLDRNEAMLNEVAMDGSHVLVLGFESTDHPVEDGLARAIAIAEDHGGDLPAEPSYEGPHLEDSDDAGEDGGAGDDRGGSEGDWRSAFFEAPYQFNTLVSLGVIVDTFETAVTWDGFPALHEAVTERVTAAMDEQCGTGFLACRFTHVYEDGPAPYYTLLAPADPGRELEQWRPIKAAASDAIEEHGGTITHHHAVGRVHRDWYEKETPAEYREALRAAKEAFDPAGVMNPGALLD